ncbi:putative glycosyltransferase, partial [Cucurbita argyrosperma subsp. sororia]
MASFRCLLLPACLLLLLLFVLLFLSIPPLFDLSQVTEAIPLASFFPITAMREGNKPMKAIFIKKKKTSLRMIEASLAEARVSIRNAVRWKNFTSEKKETYIPRGSIYRNPYAFHQLSFSY